MERELEVEAGVPVAAAIDPAEWAGGAVTARTLPGGRFVSGASWAIPTASRAPRRSSAVGGQTAPATWDMNDSPAGERWGRRLEIYHSDPREQPDMNAWRTELAFRLADGTTPS